jgi:uncharacterized membrane protein YeaQ/YmgE (transglycosylase-associated protein family)
MVNVIVWVSLGASLGWLASLIRLPNGHRDTPIDVAVGVIGAIVAGLLLAPLFGIHPANPSDFSLLAAEVSLLGAISLLGVVKFFRRLSVRTA